ncbi:guanine nucleotide-binding protein-like 1 [Melopsittacus undulatus]|uniref:Guanine nucleotide-binding protein-like 1 n=1 Tax=Melopsittacus undulatus TaxID=13146 RepID=A0A8V5GRN4_MELUD|nr:guanine nucleotide-binding protein-like 1 [Melopsittacus undulatus]
MPRKRPFSAKRKKQQLRDRRERRRGDPAAPPGSGPGSRSGSRERSSDGAAADAGDPVPPPRRHDPGRFRLQLGGPRAEALARRRRRAQEEVLEPLPESALELEPDLIYGPGLDFPRRPPWSFAMSPEELRAREEAAFGAFLRALQDNRRPAEGGTEGEDDGGDLAPFEHNLETWRQLWRVLEMSDVILLITDARHPALNVPPALATHITRELGKGLILILNKVDLTSPAVATAWSHLLRRRFPTARVVPFTSAPRRGPTAGLQRRQRRGGGWSRAVGPRQLLEACESIVGGEVDLSSWRARLDRVEAAAARGEEEEEEQQEEVGGGSEEEEEDGDEDGAMVAPRQWERYRHGVLTLGCVGLPNAGKSSVLNALLGRSAVSVSRAPGRTRYFQTHFLTPRVRLCDCPGLVFPSQAPPALQVLAGVYPISQLQEPYSAVGYLASRLPLPALLQLRPPTSAAGWTAWDICEAWAEKRGYKTAKAARNDVYRAANSILRLAADGRLRLCLRPPGYAAQKDLWEQHPETAALAELQERGGDRGVPGSAPPEEASTSEEECDSEDGAEPGEATPPASTAANPFALLGEDEC